MSTPQSAILPDGMKFAIYLEANLIQKDKSAIATACKRALGRLNLLQQKYPETSLGMTIAFGDTLWKSFGHTAEGAELKPFSELGRGLGPATQQDLLIHIQALHKDVCILLLQAVVQAFQRENLKVLQEIHGYRLVSDRGYDGFVDGTENPKLEAATATAIIPADAADAGGSYVMVQRYVHDDLKWDKCSVTEQESYVGRTKAADEELDDRLVDSHLGRVDLKENSVSLKILRRSLPYGSVTGEHGLLFISYCHCLHNIEAQLLSMFGNTDGKIDQLLRFLSAAKSGAYYFAPSVERLKNL